MNFRNIALMVVFMATTLAWSASEKKGTTEVWLNPEVNEQNREARRADFFGYENDILLLEIGHYESEQYTIEVLRDVISKFAPSLHICKAETNINPIKYL